MAAGDIVKTHAFSVEKVDIDTDEDIAAGEVINDVGGAGFEQADAANKGPFMIALEARVYATDTAAGKAHTMNALFSGIIDVLKVTGALAKGKNVQIDSATPGSVMAWNEVITDVYAIVGIVNKDAASGDATVQVRLRC